MVPTVLKASLLRGFPESGAATKLNRFPFYIKCGGIWSPIFVGLNIAAVFNGSDDVVHLPRFAPWATNITSAAATSKPIENR